MTEDLPPQAGDGPAPDGPAPTGVLDESTPPTDAPSADAPPPTDAPPPAGAPVPPVHRELRRSREDRVLSGVAGGLARTLDVDAVLVRIGLVVLALTFPPVIAAYLAAWLLLPADGDPVGRRYGRLALRDGGAGFWIGVAVLVTVVIASLDAPGLGGGFPLLPLVLIGVGVALWTREGPRRPASLPGYSAPTASTTSDPSTVTHGSTTMPTQSPPRPDAAHAGGTPPTAFPPAPSAGPPVAPFPQAPPRRRSALGAVTIALALIAAGVVAALDQVEGIPLDADPSHLAAVALLVLGLGQLVGAVWGRARWLTLVALLLIPPVLLGAAIREVDDRIAGGQIDLDLGDGIGERTLRVDRADELPDSSRLLAGAIEVDLTDWDPDAAQLAAIDADDLDLEVAVGAGQVVLRLPEDVAWRVVGDVGLGELEVREADGTRSRDASQDVGNPIEVVRAGGPAGGPVLDIQVDVRFGELIIHTNESAQELS